VFRWIDGVLLHPFPKIVKANELLAFETTTPDGGRVENSFLDYHDYGDKAHNSSQTTPFPFPCQ
jgi:hypothetical protein